MNAPLVRRLALPDMPDDAQLAQPQLWLVRHGETEWSASGRHTSRTDVDLTAAGEVAASRLRPRLAEVPFVLVLTSPRLRARRTAALAGFPDAEVTEDLAEWDYGDDEGLTTAQLREHRPGWTVWTHGPRNGETAQQVGARADRVIGRARAAGGPVLAFSHGHLSRVLGARWIGLGVEAGACFELATASVSVLGWERGTATVQLWNGGTGGR